MHRRVLLAVVLFLAVSQPCHASVVINEFLYDDGGTDDREFVELFNGGLEPVAIGGWVLGRRDAAGVKPAITIAAGTTLNAGAFYVIGQNGVPHVDQVHASEILQNDAEVLELRDISGSLIDAVVYETNKGALNPPLPPSFDPGYGNLPGDVSADVGKGIWGNNQASDLAGTPKLASNVLGRYVDGRDTNNNGRDFGYRPPTPGTTNNPISITQYKLPDIQSSPVGTQLTDYAYVSTPPRVIDPTIADTHNPNAIPSPPISPHRAVISWDSASGGGLGVSSSQTFVTPQSKFDLLAYFDTRDLPQMSMANGSLFRGSELSIYGIGSTDALVGMTNISGQLASADTTNGSTGIAWVYEKVAAPNPSAPSGPGNEVVEKLFLVDAKDGGDAGQGGVRPFSWSVLATIDLSEMASGWYRLGLDIDLNGNGVARFDDQVFGFSTDQHSGAFSVSYREETQMGSVSVPRSYLRPPTFITVPEPTTSYLLAAGTAALHAFIGRKHRRCRTYNRRNRSSSDHALDPLSEHLLS